MPSNYDDFADAVAQPPGRKVKRLRSSAREAYQALSGDLRRSTTRAQQSTENPSIFTYKRPGRGASGESSN